MQHTKKEYKKLLKELAAMALEDGLSYISISFFNEDEHHSISMQGKEEGKYEYSIDLYSDDHGRKWTDMKALHDSFKKFLENKEHQDA